MSIFAGVGPRASRARSSATAARPATSSSSTTSSTPSCAPPSRGSGLVVNIGTGAQTSVSELYAAIAARPDAAAGPWPRPPRRARPVRAVAGPGPHPPRVGALDRARCRRRRSAGPWRRPASADSHGRSAPSSPNLSCQLPRMSAAVRFRPWPANLGGWHVASVAAARASGTGLPAGADDLVTWRLGASRRRRPARPPPATPVALPITSSAAAAISSTTATSVTCITRPWASSVPRRSTTAGDAGARRWRRRSGPAATSGRTCRTRSPPPRRRAGPGARRGSAGPSGRSPSGSSAAQPRSTFDRSMPALAQTKPCRVSVMTRSPRRRSDPHRLRLDEPLWDSGSSGSTATSAALGLRDDLLRDHEDVAVAAAVRTAAPSTAAAMASASTSSGRISPMPSTPQISNRLIDPDRHLGEGRRPRSGDAHDRVGDDAPHPGRFHVVAQRRRPRRRSRACRPRARTGAPRRRR